MNILIRRFNKKLGTVRIKKPPNQLPCGAIHLSTPLRNSVLVTGQSITPTSPSRICFSALGKRFFIKLKKMNDFPQLNATEKITYQRLLKLTPHLIVRRNHLKPVDRSCNHETSGLLGVFRCWAVRPSDF